MAGSKRPCGDCGTWGEHQEYCSRVQYAQKARRLSGIGRKSRQVAPQGPRGPKKVVRGLKVSEHDVQRQILDFLRAKGIFAERRNVVAPMLPGRGGKLQPVRSGSRGAADIWGILLHGSGLNRIGQHFEIEVKVPGWTPPKNHFTRSGKVNKAYVHWQEQLAWGAAVRRAGGLWVVCRSLEEVRELLGV